MICAVAPGPVRSVEPRPDHACETDDDRFWAVLRAAGLIDRGGSLLRRPAEPTAEPAEAPARPRPTVRIAVDRERPRGPRPVPDPVPTPARWIDPDGDGRLSRQRSPPAGAWVDQPERGGDAHHSDHRR